MMPVLPVHVHDAYLAGEGILNAAVLGLVSMVNQRGTGDLAQGVLMRFFAEAAWYSTALLPSHREFSIRKSGKGRREHRPYPIMGFDRLWVLTDS